MSAIDKNRVKRSFNRGSRTYDRYSGFLRETGSRMLELCPEIRNVPGGRVLDIGCGTGYLAALLAVASPRAEVLAVDIAYQMTLRALHRKNGFERLRVVNADAEQLPFPSNTVDLAVSNVALQWVNGFKSAITEAHRVLRVGGELVCSVFGEGTLAELHQSYRAARPSDPGTSGLHSFPSSAEVREGFMEAGFQDVRLLSHSVRRWYESPLHLIRFLKQLGATNAVREPDAGLGGRRWFRKMIDLYHSRYGGPEGVYATWEVLLAAGRKR